MQKKDCAKDHYFPPGGTDKGVLKDVAKSVALSKSLKLPVARPQVVPKRRLSTKRHQTSNKNDAVTGTAADPKTTSVGDNNPASQAIDNKERPLQRSAWSKTVSCIETSAFRSILGSTHPPLKPSTESRQTRGHPVSRGIDSAHAAAAEAIGKSDASTIHANAHPNVDAEVPRARGHSRVWLRNPSIDIGPAESSGHSKIPQWKS